MPVPIYSFVGYSGTGKTTYIEKLVAELKSRGIRVAVIKHDAHNFEIDREGKDSWRFTQAGADIVAVASNEKFALVEQGELPFDVILSHIHGADIILTEGYTFGNQPKIGVFRKASGNGLRGNPEEFTAIVSDTPIDTNAPVFPLDNAAPLAEFMLKGKRAE